MSHGSDSASSRGNSYGGRSELRRDRTEPGSFQQILGDARHISDWLGGDHTLTAGAQVFFENRTAHHPVATRDSGRFERVQLRSELRRFPGVVVVQQRDSLVPRRADAGHTCAVPAQSRFGAHDTHTGVLEHRVGALPVHSDDHLHVHVALNESGSDRVVKGAASVHRRDDNAHSGDSRVHRHTFLIESCAQSAQRRRTG